MSPRRSSSVSDPSETANARPDPIGWAAAGLAALIVLGVYLPSLHHLFVNWDDPKTVLDNPHIRSLGFSSVKWMFTNFYAGFWTPLTMLSLAWDYSWGGLNPAVYHRTNLLLHMANTVLVFFLSRRLLVLAGASALRGVGRFSGPLIASFLAAILFGLHPIHVEPVAWVTGRKDLLCAFFYLLSLLVYLGYVSATGKKTWKYGASLFLFTCALLSKPMAVSLPLVLLILDAWPLGRFSAQGARVLKEKIPFFLLAAAAGAVTLLSEARLGAMPGLEHFPLDLRVMNAFHSVVFYLEKTFWPSGLSALYPIVGIRAFSVSNALSLVGVVLVSLVFFRMRKERPALITAWVYYLVTLLPVLGLVQVGGHAAADRYAYLPLLGPFLLVSYSAVVCLGRWGNKAGVVILLLLSAMAVGATAQIGLWRDPVRLWENVVKDCSDVSAIADSNLGDAYREAGRWNEAIRAYERSIVLDPARVNPYNGKASAYFSMGRWDEAEKGFRAAIAVDPKNALAHYNLGFVYAQKGEKDLALLETQEATRLDPQFAQAYNNLGIFLGEKGRIAEALTAFQKAVSLDPSQPTYRRNLDSAFRQSQEKNAVRKP